VEGSGYCPISGTNPESAWTNSGKLRIGDFNAELQSEDARYSLELNVPDLVSVLITCKDGVVFRSVSVCVKSRFSRECMIQRWLTNC
jgi:hypothetical protein